MYTTTEVAAIQADADIKYIITAALVREWLAKSTTLQWQPVYLAGHELAFLQYTGGTTGVSKVAMLTHQNMVANVLQAADWLHETLRPGKEVIITVIPLYHIFALTANCLLFVYLGGLNLLVADHKNMQQWIELFFQFSVTAISGVSTLFHLLMQHPRFAQIDWRRLRLALAGGMALPKLIADRWQECTNTVLLQAYGLTETSPAVCINHPSDRVYSGHVGFPVLGTRLSIRNDEGRELAVRQVGEVWVSGPQVMLGYWKKPVETAKVFSQGWLKTGDIGYVNPDNSLVLVDRKKDLIIVSGFNVYPSEVEAVIHQLPEVAEVAVLGVKQEVSGEVIKAIIVPKAQHSLTEEAVLAHCRAYLTSYKLPKIIEFREALPRSVLGKILKRLC